MSHVSFTDAINNIASGDWGREFATPEDAAKHVIGDLPRLTAFALVELLKRFNAVAKAVGPKDKDGYRHAKLEIPVNAKRYPNKNVGDRVFSGDLDSGFTECIIVAKNDDGICLMVAVDFDLNYPPSVEVACDWTWATLEEAIQHSAEHDMEYHAPRVKHAKSALDAVKKGGDLAAFRDGVGDD